MNKEQGTVEGRSKYEGQNLFLIWLSLKVPLLLSPQRSNAQILQTSSFLVHDSLLWQAKKKARIAAGLLY